jgi:hypothetical protein
VPESTNTSLDAVEAAYESMLAAPTALTVDGAAIGHGLPERPIGLAELRRLLLDPEVGYLARDAAWAELIRRVRSGAEDWAVAVMGLLMPALRRASAKAALGHPLTRADVDAEVVTGCLEVLRTLDPTSTRVPARLYWGAYRRAWRAGAGAKAADHLPLDTAIAGVGAVPPPGHPDLVLSAAVRARVITKYEAELVGTTRIDEVRLRRFARQEEVAENTLLRRRQAAERRLCAWLRKPVSAPLSHFGPKSGMDRCGSHRAGAATAGDQELHGSTTTPKGGEAPDRTPTCSASRPAPTPTRFARSTSQRAGQSPRPSPWPSVPPLWWPVPFPPPLRTRPPRPRSRP